MAKFLWEITYMEEYEKDGETKSKWTKVGALFVNEEKWNYSVNMYWQWFPVFDNRDKKPKPKKEEEISVEDIPF